MSGVGVISNPRSRRNRKNPGLARELTYVLGERGEHHAPRDLDALQHAVERFRTHAIDVLCVNGGDGTLHRAVTALTRVYGDAPLPRIALLRGGTMNTIANGVGVQGRPAEILDYVVTRYHAGEAMPTTPRWTMAVDASHAGFLFGTGLQAAFLEEYYRGGEPTPMKAGWVLGRAVLSAAVQGPLIQRLFRAQPMEAYIDGVRWPREAWMSVAAGTVDGIGLGFRPYFRALQEPGKMHVLGFACSGLTVARELPRMYRAQATRSPNILSDVSTHLRLSSPEPIGYMIDGDFYAGGCQVDVRIGRRVDFIVPGA